MIRPEDKPVRNERIVLREEFDDWAILFDPESGLGFGLNPVGVFVWKHLDGHHPLKEILKKVYEHFSDVTEGAENEISAFVQDLLDKGYAGYEI